MEIKPRLGQVSQEVVAYLECLDKQKEDHRLFQFLNALDESYNSHRSQLLLMPELPSVEVACSMLKQEESHREITQELSIDDASAMYNSKQSETTEKCSIYGNNWHPKEKCWAVIGYLGWHSKSKKFSQKKAGNQAGKSDQGKGTTKEQEQKDFKMSAQVEYMLFISNSKWIHHSDTATIFGANASILIQDI